MPICRPSGFLKPGRSNGQRSEHNDERSVWERDKPPDGEHAQLQFPGLPANVFQVIRTVLLSTAIAACLPGDIVWCWAAGFSAQRVEIYIHS